MVTQCVRRYLQDKMVIVASYEDKEIMITTPNFISYMLSFHNKKKLQRLNREEIKEKWNTLALDFQQ